MHVPFQKKLSTNFTFNYTLHLPFVLKFTNIHWDFCGYCACHITVIIVVTQTQCKSWAMIYVDNLLSTQDITLA